MGHFHYGICAGVCAQGPIQLTRINFDIKHVLRKMYNEIIYPFQNFNGCTIEAKDYLSTGGINFDLC